MAAILGLNAIKNTPYISSSYTPPQYPHSHDFFEISFCVSGHSVNIINGVPVSFQNGTCVILRPTDVHAVTEYNEKVYEHIDLYAKKEEFEKLCGCLHGDFFEKLMQEPNPIYFSFQK